MIIVRVIDQIIQISKILHIVLTILVPVVLFSDMVIILIIVIINLMICIHSKQAMKYEIYSGTVKQMQYRKVGTYILCQTLFSG